MGVRVTEVDPEVLRRGGDTHLQGNVWKETQGGEELGGVDSEEARRGRDGSVER